MRCFVGNGSDDQLDAAVAGGQLTTGDADAVREFRAYLALTAEHGVPVTFSAELVGGVVQRRVVAVNWTPNLLREWRDYVGLTHAAIDSYEANVWRAEVARPETEAGR